MLRKVIGWTLLALLGGATITQTAQADVVANIQFNTSSSNQYSGAAVVGAAGNFWNVVTAYPNGTAVDLKTAASGSISSGLTLTSNQVATNNGFWTASPNANAGFQSGSPYYKLMNSYLYSNATSSTKNTLTISGLSSSQLYDVYVYSQVADSGFNLRQLSVSINSGTAQTITNPNYTNNTFIQNANYLLFSGVSGSSTMNLDYWANGTEADINGIQIVAVPEPGTLLLGSIAATSGAGLWWNRRKRKPAEDTPAKVDQAATI